MSKVKSIKLNEYFALKKPEYKYIKITPHKSIRNYNSSNIAKAIANTYRSINKRIYKENKKLIFEMNYKIAYIIDIYKEDTLFYFLVPTHFVNILVEKVAEIWNKATVEIVEGAIKPFSNNADSYRLSYKKHDGLSLNVDKKLNEPLNSILSAMEIMQEKDRVTIIYNFLPTSQFGWLEKFEKMEEKFKNKECLDKENLTFEYILKTTILTVFKLIDSAMEIIQDLCGDSKKENVNDFSKYIYNALDHQNNINNSRYKKTSQVIDTQIAVISESDDATRKINNALSVCQSFRQIDGDNELKYKKISNKIKIEDYSLTNTKISTLSTDEVGQLIQIPGRTLLSRLGINHIKTEEFKIPDELRKGIKRLGTSKYKGVETKAYLEDSYDKASLPLIINGAMGGGKSTYLTNFAKDCINNNEGVIIIDYIKKCELADSIKEFIPPEKLIEIHLDNPKEMQGFGFDELKIPTDATAFEKVELANMQTVQLKQFINSIVIGDPLSTRMETILGASGDIVFTLGYTAIKDVIKCLTCHKTRMKYIDEIKKDKELADLLDEEIETLEEINEMSKVSAKDINEGNFPLVIGTRENKIEHILDRTRILRSDTKLKYMYKKDITNNVDFAKAMDEGKVIIIRMPQDKFPSKHIKNIMVTYFMSKIWLACNKRGAKHDQPRRCNILIDEIHQAPTVLNNLKEIIPQTRKFGCKLVFAIHNIDQISHVADTLESSGTSYMFLNGSLEDDFNHFKSKLEGFEYEDLRDMEQYHSLNLIYYSKGYSSFITKLPKPI